MEMITTLKISPQGQITIPKAWRQVLGVGKNSKMLARLTDMPTGKGMNLNPEPKSWVKAVAGSGKGLWGDSDKYLQKERDSWERK